jgi:hypothetical protein
MIKIKCFSSFCSTDIANSNFKKNLSSTIDKYSGLIEFTNDDDYTHAIIINTAMPLLNIPKENVIGLAFEPPYFLGVNQRFIDYANKYIGTYYIGEKNNLPEPFKEHFSFMWHVDIPPVIQTKNKLMSIIFSHKRMIEGHKYRHLLVEAILKLNLPIDIYGKGCKLINNSFKNDHRIKGEFTENEPYVGYMYSIAIENCSINDYISEKYINCVAHNTIPIYYGAKNIEKYFPNMTHILTGKLGYDINLIKSIIKSPDIHKKTIDKKIVIDTLDILKHIKDLYM